ncbi:MAG: MurT ligase domain-containing protein [Chloroflexi bacterium]|nr:MurT ligase domain-containing protein [Chloroflexota bacterium]
MRDRLAIALGKVAGSLTRVLRLGGGTAIPGLTALKLSPGILERLLEAIPQGFVFVTGTNGKTTTAAMLSRILSAAGHEVLNNRTGSNLARGLVSHLIQRTSSLGGLKVQPNSIGVFEVDEAALIAILPHAHPRVLLLTNLFRDQLDRYGEIDSISKEWGRVIHASGKSLHVVLNADDPAVVHAGARGQGDISTYGVQAALDARVPDEWADSASCPLCSAQLHYRGLTFSHLGDYTCPDCGFERPAPGFAATEVDSVGLNPARFTLRRGDSLDRIDLDPPGLFNVYNALAAAAAASALDISAEDVKTGLEGFRPAFGRAERLVVDGVELVFLLVKNPAGANEVLRSLRQDPEPANYLMALNDRAADGEDVSWIWDIDFDGLMAKSIVATGDRAEDLALRLKYAGLSDAESVIVDANSESALSRILRSAGQVKILATYTAMLELRKLLVERGVLDPYWIE